MFDLELPETREQWDALAPAILRASLALAGMSYQDLADELGRMGVRQDNKVISSKLRKGRFSSTFFLQALVAAGVKELRLPTRSPSTQAIGDRD